MVSMPLFCVLLLIQVSSLAINGAKADTYNCTYEMDVAFVVDNSGSICNDEGGPCDNWRSLLAFIHTIINSMIIGTNDVRVALIDFESYAYLRWNLSTYSDKASLLKAVDNLKFIGGNTNTIAALDLLSKVFRAEAGDRQYVRNQAILITDGKPRIGAEPYPMDQLRAAVQRVLDQGIRLLGVGVTESIDMDTLRVMSSPPHTINETVFVAKDYQNLDDVLRQLQIQNCINITDEPQTPAPESPQCTEKLDLCLVVDASGSICDSDEGFNYTEDETCNNWKYNVDFLYALVNGFDIGLATRVGLVIFASTSNVRWTLSTYADKPSLLGAIRNLTYHKGGTTDMTGGLRLMRTQVFGLSDDRQDAPNIGIIITDGYPTVPSTLQGEIDACRASGIKMMAVGVTDKIDLNTIQKLASLPSKENETYFLAHDYSTLDESVRAQLSTQTCLTPTPTPLIDIPPASTPSPKTEKPVCNDDTFDLCFVVDASGSICDTDDAFDYDTDSTCNNWNLILQFLQRIIDDIFNSPNTRIGLVVFSTTSQTIFDLTRYTNKADILAAVSNLTYTKGGTTDMTGGLRLARTEVFNTAGDRPGFPNIEVMITDGFPTEPSTVQAEIDAAHNSSIRILPLGVTDKVDESTLQRLSDPPHQINVTYFMALTFVDIESFRKVLQEKICQ